MLIAALTFLLVVAVIVLIAWGVDYLIGLLPGLPEPVRTIIRIIIAIAAVIAILVRGAPLIGLRLV